MNESSRWTEQASQALRDANLGRWLPTRTRHRLRQAHDRARRAVGLDGILRTLAATPSSAAGTIASERINALVEVNRAQLYLEVGVATGVTFEAVAVPRRQAVEPYPLFVTRAMPHGTRLRLSTSDEFFASLPTDVRYDAIFLDGLHTFEQTYRDVVNAFLHLSPGGFVLIDDTVPPDAPSSLPDQGLAEQRARELGLAFPRPWMGDVYKVVMLLDRAHAELEMYTFFEGGRHQTVAWQAGDAYESKTCSAADFTWASTLAYEEVFIEGPPAPFRVQTTAAIIDAYATAYSRRS